MKNKRKRFLKKTLLCIIGVFIVINILTAIYAHSFTHVTDSSQPISKELDYSLWDKVKMVFTGVDLPRPQSNITPYREYNTIKIPAGQDKHLEAWTIKTDSVSKGMVILYHGYMDEKSKLLRYSYPILDMGYDVMLIDFRGSGNSYGNQITIGYFEAENVKQSVDYTINTLKEDRIFLLGFSMGAAAIIKAQHDYNLPVKGLIAEATYGSMFDTIEARARLMGLGVLSKPETYLFTFWVGAINRFNAFKMNPQDYVNNITVPIMIACGGKDQYIPTSETQGIFDNLIINKNKTLIFYPDCIHELYIDKYPDEWRKNISLFFKQHSVTE